ncbi:prostatic spermine-binding protein-like isoform X1 [Peromyscus eremicus]|uniref:prostatic spermine-binding protein-like isoform X1 n=2 Tax=Peromyscus eremicus TaxID=42410 RepID=UPI0027DCA847|nr:prostatic spermine-binding protein-like isoform X1 [Peromyscus eremicus]
MPVLCTVLLLPCKFVYKLAVKSTQALSGIDWPSSRLCSVFFIVSTIHRPPHSCLVNSGGAMLLLLTLAVLAGATCRAQNILGNTIGSYFYIHGEEQGEIKAIRIFYTLARRLKGIQLQFQNNWSDIKGVRSSRYEEFLLNDDEYVIKVLGTVGLCLNSLTFITNKGTEFSFGKKKGRPIVESGGPDQHLQTVNGMHSPVCLQGIGFKWTYNTVMRPGEPVPISNTNKVKEDIKDKYKVEDDDDDDDDDEDDHNIDEE